MNPPPCLLRPNNPKQPTLNPWQLRLAPPRVGEHTHEVLREVLTEDELARVAAVPTTICERTSGRG